MAETFFLNLKCFSINTIELLILGVYKTVLIEIQKYKCKLLHVTMGWLHKGSLLMLFRRFETIGHKYLFIECPWLYLSLSVLMLYSCLGGYVNIYIDTCTFIIAHKLAVCLRNSTPNILAERMDKRYIDKQWVLDKNV